MKHSKPHGARGDDVSRRDFLNGVALSVGAALVPGALTGCAVSTEPGTRGLRAAQDLPGYYPPALTGMRGSHPGAFEAAHALRDGKAPPPASPTGEVYDLIVVGAGLSGLSAAYFYRDRVPGARILILDNHDDFGGHAKRNEFTLGGRLQLMNGGTFSIESPTPYSAVSERLIERLGIHPKELVDTIQDPRYYESRGLVGGVFLDRETFGADALLRQAPGENWGKILAGAPFSDRAKREIAELEDGARDYLPHLAPAAKKQLLLTTSYADFLSKIVGADPAVVRFYQQRTHGLWGVGIDAVSALECWATGMAGFRGLSLPPGSIAGMGETAAGFSDTGGSIDVHLPDGGATIARALVRQLIPGVLSGNSPAELVLERADYARLDQPGSPVRLRLSSTAVHVANDREGANEGVSVDYQRDGRVYRVQGRHAVLACWNAMIPYLCPALPEPQKAALHELVKTPIIYANVAIRSGRPLHRLGLSAVHCPGGYFCDINLNEYMHVGRYATPTDPDAPTILRLVRTPCAPGLRERDQNRAGRADILATDFARYEREIRAQLGRVLASGGFDAHEDILGITVNRWPHGYAPEFNPLFDEMVPESEQPHVRGRARHGAIAIANSDAGLKAYIDSAIDQAARAVGELVGVST